MTNYDTKNHKYSVLTPAHRGLKRREEYIALMEKMRELYVGRQDIHQTFKTNNNRIFKCNISGKLVQVNTASYKALRAKYGTDEAIQERFLSFRYSALVKKYGIAWLYIQITPDFLSLKKKIQLLIYWYNTVIPEKVKSRPTWDNKIKKILLDHKIKKYITVFYNKDNKKYVKGVWLKELPFIYDIYVEAHSQPEKYVEVEPDEMADDDPGEEYEFPLAVE